MSVAMFANALRTHSRIRVLTATRVAFPAMRSIGSLVAYRTAVPKNVSLLVSRSFATSQVARNDYDDYGVKSAPSSTIFVANLPWSAKEEDILDLFSEFGKVISVRMHMNPDGRPRGICHVDYESKDSAVAAMASASEEPLHMAGRDLRLDFSSGNRVQQVTEPSEKLYFSGCAGDEVEIRTLFKAFGKNIVDIHLLKDANTGERLPAGFVQLSSVDVATAAMESLNGTMTPDGEPLAVSYARPRRFQSRGFSDQGNRRGFSAGNFGGNRRESSDRWD